MKTSFPKMWSWLGLGLVVVGVIAFIVLTPPGLLDKLDYIAAAVCHRLPGHSFFVHGRQSPLCQRCSGTFPGALTGLLVHWLVWRRRRSAGFPKWPFFVASGFFAMIWALDGVNSFTSEASMQPILAALMTRAPGVGVLGYAPQPWLRLLSGALMGASMSILLVPAFNQTFWADAEAAPSLRSWHEFGFLVAVELAMAGLIYLRLPLLLLPVSLYSTLGVVAMFTLLGAMIFLMFLGRDATLSGWREAGVPLLWGVVFALLIIGTMNGLRWMVFGSIDGVPGLSQYFVALVAFI